MADGHEAVAQARVLLSGPGQMRTEQEIRRYLRCFRDDPIRKRAKVAHQVVGEPVAGHDQPHFFERLLFLGGKHVTSPAGVSRGETS